ncbi:MAG: hypothetical protein V4803_32820, partial [Burkholderia gladioli]
LLEYPAASPAVFMKPSLSHPCRHPFLTCLRGSELVNLLRLHVHRFLSCLRGSEHDIAAGIEAMKFLSCLRGSEPLHPLVAPG